jgi:hypothetical protein
MYIIQIQIEYFNTLYYILIMVSFESCGVQILYTIVHMSRII